MRMPKISASMRGSERSEKKPRGVAGAAGLLRRAEIPPAGLRALALTPRLAGVLRDFFAVAFFVAILGPPGFCVQPIISTGSLYYVNAIIFFESIALNPCLSGMG